MSADSNPGITSHRVASFTLDPKIKVRTSNPAATIRKATIEKYIL
jgi:hypothetical protein